MLLLLLSCTSPDWLAPSPPEGEPCTAEGTVPLTGRRQVRLLLDGQTDPAVIARHTQLAAGYYAARGLTLTLAGTDRAPRGMLLGEGSTPEAILAPLASLVQAHAQPADPQTVLVVVVPRLADPASPAGRLFTDLSALSFSPALAAEAAAQTGFDVRTHIGEDFTPFVLISGESMAVSRPGKIDLMLAHEIGHALGLPHIVDADSLMRQRRWFDCVPVLTDAQRQRLQGG